jgi:beta-glucanase (GH16 family)
MYRFLALPLALLATHAVAQTSTTCDPTKKTCPEDPALGTTFQTTFNESMVAFDPDFFNLTAGTDLVSFSDKGAELTIAKQGDSVTVETAFYIMFGTMEIIFQAASGQGIISTVVFLSDDLDEIDIEIMGGNTTNISNNFYGQGNTSQFNSEYPTVNWSGGAPGGFHNYTVNWSADQIEWIMDGATVRTQPYMAPGLYPQTPCYIKFGIWAGGDPSNPKGTIQWAGGLTNYNDG